MKQPTFAALALLTFAGCAHGQPTAFERGIYDIRTNWVMEVTLKTNVVLQGTNTIVVIQPVTNAVETHTYATKPIVTSTISTASGVAGTFGFGWAGALGTLVMSALAAWAQYRSSRRGKLNQVHTNSLQVGREMILATAGPEAEAEFVDSMSSAQVKAGVKELAVAVKDSHVDEKEAREEAASVVSLAKKASASKPSIA